MTFQNARWKWYQEALNDPSKIGTDALPIHANEYQVGYYRTRHKNSQWEPVGIYPDESGADVGYRSDKRVGDLQELFLWSCRHPISYETYIKALEGEGFDDEPPAPIGDNSGDADSFEALRIELEGEIELLASFMKREVTVQAEADKIGIWSKRLADIGKRADGLRVVEKEPHLTASREVDAKWRPLIDDAKDWTSKAKKHVEAFLIAQKRAEEARARAAAEEGARLRREAEALSEALRTAQQTDDRAEAERVELLRQAQEAEKAAEIKNVNAGRTGARVSVRVDKIGVVYDYGKAAAALVAMKHQDMLAMIDTLANRAARAAVPVAFDGMEIIEQEKIV